MTKFESIGVNFQMQARCPDYAERCMEYSCKVCSERGMRIECDRCAIRNVHEHVMATFENSEPDAYSGRVSA